MRKYKITGIISLLAGAVYAARAFTLLRVQGELPITNTYLFVIGILLCTSALGVYICVAFTSPASSIRNCCGKGSERYHGYLILTLVCFIVFALLFERIGTVKASFILSFILGTIWNHKKVASKEAAQKFSFIGYFAANKKNIAENILASCVCASGIWLVNIKVFNLSLP